MSAVQDRLQMPSAAPMATGNFYFLILPERISMLKFQRILKIAGGFALCEMFEIKTDGLGSPIEKSIGFEIFKGSPPNSIGFFSTFEEALATFDALVNLPEANPPKANPSQKKTGAKL